MSLLERLPANETVEFDAIQAIANSLGFSAIGVSPREVAVAALKRSSVSLGAWQESGYAGEMGFMSRPPELFSDIEHFLPECRSVVAFLISYAPPRQSEVQCPPGYGRVAKYAWGRDYHRVLKRKLAEFSARVSAECLGGREIVSRGFSDAVPLLERSLAAASLRGFVGKNTMYIVPGVGSFTFLAELLWSVEVVGLPGSAEVAPPGGGCGSCERCIVNCPTNAFVSPGVLDARRCISYLTIEKRGEFSEWEEQAIGDWVFGCDICQDVCPFNHRGVPQTAVPEFFPVRDSELGGGFLALADILAIRSHEEFAERFGGTALMRTGREGLLRNACAVVVHQHNGSMELPLRTALREDASAVVRASASRALHRLGLN